ncbi:unnamed protein product [Fusarium venenatum]|uniref:Uncharacterized protein n=1 Tax=Fusarium venenatum TaxID=56646 RepID=A0A2L2T6V4_9HYPO|nr:uncharacterized protein FVRRES_01961 [Fusarium venenatum]CEI65449.1 unnamed protein product [Fusarium venenatum]
MNLCAVWVRYCLFWRVIRREANISMPGVVNSLTNYVRCCLCNEDVICRSKKERVYRGYVGKDVGKVGNSKLKTDIKVLPVGKGIAAGFWAIDDTSKWNVYQHGIVILKSQVKPKAYILIIGTKTMTMITEKYGNTADIIT